jgi:hypothetical protein
VRVKPLCHLSNIRQFIRTNESEGQAHSPNAEWQDMAFGDALQFYRQRLYDDASLKPRMKAHREKKARSS